MFPNVMPGREWIHSIAAAVINHNVAAAPPMSKHRHSISELQVAMTHLKT